MARFHPPQAVLVDYALGNLGEPQALLVATHLTFCPTCRQVVAMEEDVAGIFLEEAEPGDGEPAGAEEGLAGVLSRLDDPAVEPEAPPPPSDGVLPRTFAPYLPSAFADLRWRTIVPGFREATLIRAGRASARLIHTRPGKGVANHTHDGMELTLVLWGTLADGDGHYERGDVTVADDDTHHGPMAAGDEDCMCLIVVEAPLRFTGAWGPVLNFLAR